MKGKRLKIENKQEKEKNIFKTLDNYANVVYDNEKVAKKIDNQMKEKKKGMICMEQEKY